MSSCSACGTLRPLTEGYTLCHRAWSCFAVKCSVFLDLIPFWFHFDSCWARFGTRFRQFLSGCAAKLVFFTGRSPQNLVRLFGWLVVWSVGCLVGCLVCFFFFLSLSACLFACLFLTVSNVSPHMNRLKKTTHCERKGSVDCLAGENVRPPARV